MTKPASVYWAWTWPTGDRRAYKQFYCVEHAYPLVVVARRARQNVEDCTRCGLDFSPEDTPVVVWATIYFPKTERIDAYAEFHAKCFEEAEPEMRQYAIRLADRGSGEGAPRPDLTHDPWEALGAEALAST